MRQLIRAALIVTAAAGLVVVAQTTAEAKCSKMKEIEDYKGNKKKVPRMGKPERRFKGKILTSGKSFPTSARSESAYISKVKKHTKSKFWEDKEKKQWKIYFIAFFKAPLDDMEVRIRIHDITRGHQRMLSSFDQFVDRCATSYASNMVLKREQFGVNKKLLVTVETTSGHVLSSGKIEIRGEAEKFTGKADFSDEIAKDDDEEEAKPEEPKEEPEVAELPEEKEEELDLNDKSILNAPDLSYSEGQKAPQETEKKSGCGCRSSGEGAAGSLALFGLVFGLCAVRRRRR